MKITIIYIDEKLLLFVCGIFHEEAKRGMISLETTHKRISIHVFITSVTQKKVEK